MQPSNPCTCYEGVQRIYRNSVRRHIRTRLTALYPNDFTEKLRKPFEKEWDKIRASVHTSADNPENSLLEWLTISIS